MNVNPIQLIQMIKSGQNPQQLLMSIFQRKVLCHQITHAAMFSYNVNLSLEQEELIADLISTYGDEIIYITNKIFNKLQSL